MGSYDLAIKCPRLRKPNYGMISPTDCAETKKLYGAQCAFACNPGFQLQGPSIRYKKTMLRFRKHAFLFFELSTLFLLIKKLSKNVVLAELRSFLLENVMKKDSGMVVPI